MTTVNVKYRKDNTVETIKISCPSCYAEMKVRHYIRILKEWEDGSDIADRDYYKLFDILTDGLYTGFDRTVENQVSLIDLIGWVITEPFEFGKDLPKVLNFKGKFIDIPRSPRELSIGQNIHLRRDYVEQSKKIEENIAIATAIYLQPIIDNSLFKMPRAIEICKEIEEMPINLIYPIGFFLLQRSLRFGMRPEKTWLPIRISLKQTFAQMFRDLRKYIS